MKKRRREWLLTWLGILMLSTLAIAVLGVQSTCAFAAASKINKENALTPYTKTEDGYSKQSGITVTTSLDKPKYKSGETANVTVEVKNTSKYDVSEVKVKYKLPNNIKLTSGRQFETIKTLAANETKKLTLTATVTEDQNAPLVKGAYTPYIVGAICAFSLLHWLLFSSPKRKRENKRSPCCLYFFWQRTASFTSHPQKRKPKKQKTVMQKKKVRKIRLAPPKNQQQKPEIMKFLWNSSFSEPPYTILP